VFQPGVHHPSTLFPPKILYLSSFFQQKVMDSPDSKPASVGGNSVGKSVSQGHVRSDTTHGTDMHGLGTFDDTIHILSDGSNYRKLRTDAIGTVPVNGDWSVGLKMGGSNAEPIESGFGINNGSVEGSNVTDLVGEAVSTVGFGLNSRNRKGRYDRNRSVAKRAKRDVMKKKKWIEKRHGRIAIINPYIPRALRMGNEKKKITFWN